MNQSSIRILLAVVTSLAVISAASAAPPTKTAATSKGPTLTDAKGMSLYTFVKDQKSGDISGDGFLNGV